MADGFTLDEMRQIFSGFQPLGKEPLSFAISGPRKLSFFHMPLQDPEGIAGMLAAILDEKAFVTVQDDAISVNFDDLDAKAALDLVRRAQPAIRALAAKHASASAATPDDPDADLYNDEDPAVQSGLDKDPDGQLDKVDADQLDLLAGITQGDDNAPMPQPEKPAGQKQPLDDNDLVDPELDKEDPKDDITDPGPFPGVTDGSKPPPENKGPKPKTWAEVQEEEYQSLKAHRVMNKCWNIVPPQDIPYIDPHHAGCRSDWAQKALGLKPKALFKLQGGGTVGWHQLWTAGVPSQPYEFIGKKEVRFLMLGIVPHFSEEEAKGTVAIARARGWRSINVHGRPGHKEDMWFASAEQNLNEFLKAYAKEQEAMARGEKNPGYTDQIFFQRVGNFMPLPDSDIQKKLNALIDNKITDPAERERFKASLKHGRMIGREVMAGMNANGPDAGGPQPPVQPPASPPPGGGSPPSPSGGRPPLHAVPNTGQPLPPTTAMPLQPTTAMPQQPVIVPPAPAPAQAKGFFRGLMDAVKSGWQAGIPGLPAALLAAKEKPFSIEDYKRNRDANIAPTQGMPAVPDPAAPSSRPAPSAPLPEKTAAMPEMKTGDELYQQAVDAVRARAASQPDAPVTAEDVVKDVFGLEHAEHPDYEQAVAVASVLLSRMEAEGILISPPETPSQPSVPPHADIEVDVDLDDLKAPALAQTAPGLPLTGATDDALDRIAADIASEYKTRGLIIDESGLMNEVFDRHGKLLTPQQAEAVLKRREDDDMKKPVESPRADFAAVAKPPAADAPVVVAARTPPKRNENYQTAPQKVMLSPDIENDPGYKSAVAFVQNVVVDRAAKTVVPSDIAQEVLGKTPADKDYADAHKKAQTILAAMEKNNIVDKPNALGARKVTPVTIPADIHDRPTPVPPKPPTLKDAFKEEVTPVYSKEQQKTLLGMAQDIQRAHDAGKKKPTDTKPGK